MGEDKAGRRETLLAIFALHAKWAGSYAFACRKGCATCCTRSVTMTTLEGELILDHLHGNRPELLSLLNATPEAYPAPATTNQFAAACLRGEEITEDAGSWDLRPCVFLRDGCCAIYPTRPFMCRSFGSRVFCDELGEAEVEPLYLTLNTVFLQCIEHLDRGRPWGNMNTILCSMAEGGMGRISKPGQLRTAQPLPGLLLLPEEESALAGKLRALLDLVTG